MIQYLTYKVYNICIYIYAKRAWYFYLVYSQPQYYAKKGVGGSLRDWTREK